MKKKKKQVRNKFRDRLADYYLTNREITKEADARYKKEREEGVKRSWTKSEDYACYHGYCACFSSYTRILVIKVIHEAGDGAQPCARKDTKP